MKKELLFFAVLLILFVPVRTVASVRADTVISLLTSYPGTDIYELEGHSAIRVNCGPGEDYAVSFGMFDFNAPNFVYRFVKGETDYMVGKIPTNAFLYEYARNNRRVEETPLNLNPEQKRRLIDLLEENLLPENRVYRYNYVKDNCATRPLAIIERAVADSLTLGKVDKSKIDDAATFREVMRHYHKNYPWYQFGIDLALGSGIDYKISDREYAFVPMLMAQQVEDAEIAGMPLAGTTRVLVNFTPDQAVENPTPWYLSPDAVCWCVFLFLLWATVRDIKRRRVTRWVDAVYFGILGMLGLLLTFLIFISVHEATSPNWLYLWLNPLCLIPPIFIWLKKCNIVVFWYQIINFALILFMLVSWTWIPQSANSAFWPLVLGDLMRSANYIYISRLKIER